MGAAVSGPRRDLEAAPPPSPAAPADRARSDRARSGGARRSAWTLLVVPPARAPGVVRTLSLRRWQGRVALALLGAGLLAATWAGGYATARWHERTLDAMWGEIATADAHRALADRRARTLRDSIGVLRELLAARDARETGPRPAGAPSARRVRPVAARAALRPAEGVLLPLDGRITSGYSRARLHPILRIRRPHWGIDVAAPSGTPITAPAAGRVVKVARELGYGLVVHVDHGGGVQTRYAHCRSAAVRPGEQVEAGQLIATVGRTGLATAPHLHYEVRVGGAAVDPLRHRFAPRPSGRPAAPPPASAASPAAAPAPAAESAATAAAAPAASQR